MRIHTKSSVKNMAVKGIRIESQLISVKKNFLYAKIGLSQKRLF